MLLGLFELRRIPIHPVLEYCIYNFVSSHKAHYREVAVLAQVMVMVIFSALS